MKTKLGRWLDDFRWAMNVMRARRIRRKLRFSSRRVFDDALRPKVSLQRLRNAQDELSADAPPFTSSAVEVDYPDAFYLTTVEDVIRAMDASATPSGSESNS